MVAKNIVRFFMTSLPVRGAHVRRLRTGKECRLSGPKLANFRRHAGPGELILRLLRMLKYFEGSM